MLERLNENMKFKGGPDDNKYKNKVMEQCEQRRNVMNLK